MDGNALNEGIVGSTASMTWMSPVTNKPSSGPKVAMANPEHEPVGQVTMAGVVYAKTKCGALVRITPKNSKNHKKGKN